MMVRGRLEQWRSTTEAVVTRPERFYRGVVGTRGFRDSSLFLLATQAFVFAVGIGTAAPVFLLSRSDLTLYAPFLIAASIGVVLGPVFLYTLTMTLVGAGFCQAVHHYVGGEGRLAENFSVLAYSQGATVLYLPLAAMLLPFAFGYVSPLLAVVVGILGMGVTAYILYVQIIGFSIVQNISPVYASAPFLVLAFLVLTGLGTYGVYLSAG